jgi:hypothetical protein
MKGAVERDYMRDKLGPPPLSKPLPWMAIVAVVVTVASIAVLIVGAILNRIVNNGCVDECLTLADTTMQAHMALAAWSVVIVSALSGAASLYLIWRTLQAAQRSAEAAWRTIDETRQIGRAGTRAYLSIGSVTWESDMLFGTLTVTLQNTGQSPALNVRVEASAHGTVGAFFDDDPTKLTAEAGSANWPNISAGSSAQQRIVFTRFEPDQAMKDDGRLNISADVIIAVAVSYDDVFGDDQDISGTFRRTFYVSHDWSKPAALTEVP